LGASIVTDVVGRVKLTPHETYCLLLRLSEGQQQYNMEAEISVHKK
jgi:hypothetical protein